MLRALLIALVAAAVFGTAGGRAGAPPTRVTFIGDSIPSAIAYDPAATRALEQGVDVDLQFAVCRRLVGTSCPYEGSQPLTLVDLLPTLQLGPTAVVAVGYNDFEQSFAESVATTLDALRKAGAVHILWLTFREERESYARMNNVIRAIAARNPDMTVVDWNLYSRSHPDWFQDDGLHLDDAGALAMATLVHNALEDMGVVAAPAAPTLTITTKSLPRARVGRPYMARLTAIGGTRPIRWARKAGALPRGLKLQPDGRLTGTPRTSGRMTPTLLAVDARGASTARRFGLVVRPS